jgi:hypothetical protein
MPRVSTRPRTSCMVHHYFSIYASTDRLAILHMYTLHADQAFNNAAEKHMLQTIKQAVLFDKRRVELVCLSDADGTEAVHVRSEDLTAVRYVLTDPATRFAACSCPVATQQKPCKHQVAWLLPLAPAERQAVAERLVLSFLGTLLGFAGGCSMESTSDLSVALKNLLPVAATFHYLSQQQKQQQQQIMTKILMLLRALMTLECLPCLCHACLAPWPCKTTGRRYMHCWRIFWVPWARQIQACSTALHCSRRLCWCGREMPSFQRAAQPTRLGRISPLLLTSR